MIEQEKFQTSKVGISGTFIARTKTKPVLKSAFDRLPSGTFSSGNSEVEISVYSELKNATPVLNYT